MMTEKDPFYMNEHETLKQDQETGVPPAASNNVQSIDKDVLLVRSAKGSHYDGMGGGGLVVYWNMCCYSNWLYLRKLLDL